MPREFLFVGRTVALPRLGGGQYLQDTPAADGDRVVIQHPSIRGYRDNPAPVYQCIDIQSDAPWLLWPTIDHTVTHNSTRKRCLTRRHGGTEERRRIKRLFQFQHTWADSHRPVYSTADDNTSDFILIHLFILRLFVRMFFLTEVWVTIRLQTQPNPKL
jgi:hypothetical protein